MYFAIVSWTKHQKETFDVKGNMKKTLPFQSIGEVLFLRNRPCIQGILEIFQLPKQLNHSLQNGRGSLQWACQTSIHLGKVLLLPNHTGQCCPVPVSVPARLRAGCLALSRKHQDIPGEAVGQELNFLQVPHIAENPVAPGSPFQHIPFVVRSNRAVLPTHENNRSPGPQASRPQNPSHPADPQMISARIPASRRFSCSK